MRNSALQESLYDIYWNLGRNVKALDQERYISSRLWSMLTDKNVLKVQYNQHSLLISLAVLQSLGLPWIIFTTGQLGYMMDGANFNAVAEILNREEERSYTEDLKKSYFLIFNFLNAIG